MSTYLTKIVWTPPMKNRSPKSREEKYSRVLMNAVNDALLQAQSAERWKVKKNATPVSKKNRDAVLFGQAVNLDKNCCNFEENAWIKEISLNVGGEPRSLHKKTDF